jgi:hypothetical protein
MQQMLMRRNQFTGGHFKSEVVFLCFYGKEFRMRKPLGYYQGDGKIF